MTGSRWRMLAMQALLDGQLDHPGDKHLARSRAGALGFRGLDRRLEPRQDDLGNGEDDLVLGVVLVVDGRLRHAERRPRSSAERSR